MRTHFDVLILGAGPAGLEAARTLARLGQTVGLVDEQADPGGQIGRRRIRKRGASRRVRAWLEADPRVSYFPEARVVDADPTPALFLESARGATRLSATRLILAPGARELILPFPGWTLPGVYGAGGLQALAKSGWPVRGRKIVLAGSGPLLLASAHSLLEAGGHILALLEQAPSREVARFLGTLPLWPEKVFQTLGFIPDLLRAHYQSGAWVAEAMGDDRLRAVRIVTREGSRTLACDLLGVGYGLIPNVEVAALLGCALSTELHPAVHVNAFQETSRPGIYAAGEVTGVGGAERARLEGAIAAYAASGEHARAQVQVRRRKRWARFGIGLRRRFAIRDPIRHLAGPETIVCRCEDVTLGEIDAVGINGSRRLLTRLGMGPCQGRFCQPALAELRPAYASGGETSMSRPPLVPTRLDTLAGGSPESADPDPTFDPDPTGA